MGYKVNLQQKVNPTESNLYNLFTYSIIAQKYKINLRFVEL